MSTSSSLWLDPQPLVLASASETRATLLRQAGILVACHPADIDERAVAAPLETAGASPVRIARHLAIAKAKAVSETAVGRITLGADQVLVGPQGQLHKPRDRVQAVAQLQILSGKKHRLVSAFALMRDGVVLHRGQASADLAMRVLSNKMINQYLDATGDAVFTSVGGYQLERLGVHLFASVRGEHSTILGLPMLPVLAALRQLRLVAA